jgi:hypothetical protein
MVLPMGISTTSLGVPLRMKRAFLAVRLCLYFNILACMVLSPRNRKRGYSFPVVILKLVYVFSEAVSVESFVVGFEVAHKLFNYLLFAVGSGDYFGNGFVMLSREGQSWSNPLSRFCG